MLASDNISQPLYEHRRNKWFVFSYLPRVTRACVQNIHSFPMPATRPKIDLIIPAEFLSSLGQYTHKFRSSAVLFERFVPVGQISVSYVHKKQSQWPHQGQFALSAARCYFFSKMADCSLTAPDPVPLIASKAIFLQNTSQILRIVQEYVIFFRQKSRAQDRQPHKARLFLPQTFPTYRFEIASTSPK